MSDDPTPPVVADGFAHQPNCMGCGPDNESGLRMRFTVDGERVRGALRFNRCHEGSPGLAHGGAVAAALDDLLGTVLVVIERLAVTAQLVVDFRAPAVLDRDLDLLGWCERIDGRKLHLRGEIRDGTTLIAEGGALFVEVDREHFARSGQPLPTAWHRWRPLPAA
jgi:acyl-coenzyme A thioesterase PaaI-like protein